MSSESYNGWSNWETWNTNLWINNNQYLYDTIMERACDIALETKNDRYATFTDMRISIEHMIKDVLLLNDVTEGWISDMFHSAVERVDFSEIAKLIMEECIRKVEL